MIQKEHIQNFKTLRQAFMNNDVALIECNDVKTNAPVIVMAMVNAVRLAGDPEHLRILRLAWEAKFDDLKKAPPPGPGQGKAYTGTIYGCPEAAGLLARLS